MHIIKKSRASGFTFIELMIALVINALLLTVLLTVYINNLDHYNRLVKANRLQEQMQSILQLIARDIRRAGYWSNANSDIGSDSNDNPFMASGADITVGAGNTCILMTYDHLNTGSLPSITSSADDDRYGYQLNGQIVQSRPRGATYACNNPTTGWENITDSNVIQVTALTFTLNTVTISTGPGTAGITVRSVDITMTARLASDTSITKTLTKHIKIRNDKFIP